MRSGTSSLPMASWTWPVSPIQSHQRLTLFRRDFELHQTFDTHGSDVNAEHEHHRRLDGGDRS